MINGGYVNGKWQSINTDDFRPFIAFEVIADAYF
jgi:hypothetical protein